MNPTDLIVLGTLYDGLIQGWEPLRPFSDPVTSMRWARSLNPFEPL